MSASDRGHVCIYTTAHPVDDVRVNSKIADSLLAAGYRVTWVGPERSYYRESTTPDARIDYRLFRPNNSKWRRMTSARAARRLARHLLDIDWWYCPDPDAATSAVLLAGSHGGRVLFDIHEVFHGALLDRWFPGRPNALVRHAVRRRIARTCRQVELVAGVSDAVLKPYVAERQPRIVVHNCAPMWFADRNEEGLEVRRASDRIRVAHGKCVPNNGTGKVVEAARLLTEPASSRLHIHLSEAAVANDHFTREIKKALDVLPAGLATLEPGRPHRQMPALLQSCHVGMVAYGRDLGIDSLPNRLFEYMASGLAILAPSYATEIAQIVEAERNGLLVDFEDPQAIADALQWICDHPDEIDVMGERSRRAFIQRYNWDAEAANLIHAMDERAAS